VTTRTALAALLLVCSAARAADRAGDALTDAYPSQIAGHDAATLLWRDGTRMALGDDDPAKSFADRLSHATLRDQLGLAYPAGAPLAAPPQDFDPGRFRNKAFFDHLYGDCRKREVEKTLVPVIWLPHAWGRTILFTPRAAGALRAASAEIDTLPADVRHAAWPIAGTYACRGVADAGQPSMHAYGAAIDLNLAVSNYWLWDTAKNGPKNPPVWRNRMPREIVDIFERHGFIWGGRWYHYDTMHFEYRPELLVGAGTEPRHTGADSH
jgi:D-alanyl-D-alanine carboxypeptidase